MTIRFQVPVDLRARRQWVVWRSEQRGRKRTKTPYRPTSPSVRASATDPKTWGSFEQAVGALERGGCDGVGYVFSRADPFVGVDIDECVTSSGELDTQAAGIVALLDSYTELSPSGTGIHVIVRGRLDGDSRRRKGRVEVYSDARYFTVTGRRLPGLPHAPLPRQQQLDELRTELFPAAEPPPRRPPQPVTVDDRELLDRALRSPSFRRLWEGSVDEYGGDHSRADLALCARLVFFAGGNLDQVDRLFRSSGLYRRKWERPSYREPTLRAALR